MYRMNARSAIPFTHKSVSSFWLTSGFGLLCIISQPFIGYFGFKDAQTYKRKVYGWPIIRLGYIYLVVQLLLCIISFIVGAFVGIPFWIILVIEVIIVGLVLIGLIVSVLGYLPLSSFLLSSLLFIIYSFSLYYFIEEDIRLNKIISGG